MTRMAEYRPMNRELTRTEHEATRLVAQGLKNKDIGKEMGTTEHVVKNYLRSIYDKLGMYNRVEVALWYERRVYDGAHEERSFAQAAGK